MTTKQALSLLAADTLYLATCWEIVRQDGVTLRFTDHNSKLTHNGVLFDPTEGFSATAREREGKLKGGTVDTLGVVSDSRITERDLRHGKYRQAKLLEYIVDWRYPFLNPVVMNSWLVVSTKCDDGVWEAEVNSMIHPLTITRGDTYTRTCNNVFGDGIALSGNGARNCMWDQETEGGINPPIAAGGRFSGAAVSQVISTSPRRIFSLDSTALAEPSQFNASRTPDDHFNFGRLKWTSGDNLDVEMDVMDSKVNSGDVKVQDIHLFIQSPSEVQVGDTAIIYVGCDRTFGTCQSKFQRQDDFEGWPHMPGLKRVLFRPSRE